MWIIYMCAVFITMIVGRAEVYEKDEQVQEWFGGVARSMYTLVEVMTGEWVEPERYSRESDYNLRTMVEMMKVLETVQLTVEDRNMSLVLHHFHRWYQGTGQEEEEELRLKGALKSFQIGL